MLRRTYWTVPKTEVTYREAVTMSRFWWNRHSDLPWWRPFAKREALECAQRWGEYSKLLHAEPLLGSDDVQPPGDTERPR